MIDHRGKFVRRHFRREPPQRGFDLGTLGHRKTISSW
jgi:hypothetical protein